MYLSYLFLLFILISCQKEEILPVKIAGLKHGIFVEHNLEEVRPKFYDKQNIYKWGYQTTIMSNLDNVEIIEFGAYKFINNIWVEVNDKPFGNKEFYG